MAWKPSYVSNDDIAEYVRIDDDVDDLWLDLAVAASSRAVDRHCLRQFGRVAATQTRRYRVRRNRTHGAWVADIDDLMSVDALTINGVAQADPTLYPLNAAEDGWPWTQLVIPDDIADALDDPYVDVAERWGWLAVPETIQQVTFLQASRLVKRRDAAFGVAGSPEAGSEIRLLAKLDPDVAVLIPAYRRRVRPR